MVFVWFQRFLFLAAIPFKQAQCLIRTQEKIRAFKGIKLFYPSLPAGGDRLRATHQTQKKSGCYILCADQKVCSPVRPVGSPEHTFSTERKQAKGSFSEHANEVRSRGHSWQNVWESAAVKRENIKKSLLYHHHYHHQTNRNQPAAHRQVALWSQTQDICSQRPLVFSDGYRRKYTWCKMSNRKTSSRVMH